MLGRIIHWVSIPLTLLGIWGLIRQVGKEQPVKISTPLVGLVMAPVTLLINVVLLRQAFPSGLGPALLVLGLGFGVAWGQTTRLYAKGSVLVGKRSVTHLMFWAASYALTQLLAMVVPARWVAGGLAAMFFSTGSTLGTNLNLLLRQLRMRPSLAVVTSMPPAELPERPDASQFSATGPDSSRQGGRSPQ